MKLYIIYEKKVISDSGGKPRSFERRQAAHNFIRTHQLFGAEITLDIEGINGRHRINPKNPWKKR